MRAATAFDEEEEKEKNASDTMSGNEDENDLCLTTFDVRDFAAHTIQTAARYRRAILTQRYAAAAASYLLLLLLALISDK